MTKTLLERFTEKLAEPFDAHNDCFMWKGSKGKGGYGRIKISGSGVPAHRVSYRAYEREYYLKRKAGY